MTGSTIKARARKAWDYFYAFLFSVLVMVGVVLAGALCFDVKAHEGLSWFIFAVGFCAAIVSRRLILLHRGRRKHL
jgi:hypothetical protein